MGVAAAQEGPLSVDVERFRPHLDTHGYGVTESAASLGHLEVGVGLWGGYEEDSVVLFADGARVLGTDEVGDSVIDRRGMANLQLGLGLGNRVGLSLDLPMVLWQKGVSLQHIVDTSQERDLVPSGSGDLRGQVKVTVVDFEESPLGVAVLVRGSAPTGVRRSLIGEGGPTAEVWGVLEVADGPVRSDGYTVRVAANGGVRIREKASFRGLELDEEFVFAGALGLRPVPEVELGAEVYGAFGGPDVAHRSLEIAPFLKLYPGRDVTLTFGGGIGLMPGLGTPDARGFIGGTLSPSFDPRVRDRDRDGIVDKRDACINIPEDLDGVEDYDGCPEDDVDGDNIADEVDACPTVAEDFDGWEDTDGCPELDNDNDGFPDGEDGCPDQPETVNGYLDDDGCPDDGRDSDGDRIRDVEDRCPNEPEDYDGWEDQDGCPEDDNDRDGYLDGDDTCPNQPETWNDWKDGDGCPDSADDSDGDGIKDEVDQCPDDREDIDGFKDGDGCPDLDNDEDGLPDVEDGCPDDAEIFNGYLDEDGCPDRAPSRVEIVKERIVIAEQVFFEVNKADIKPRSASLLDEIARILVDHPELTAIRVEGHTDSDGESLYNLTLSQARAESVVAALVERGVDEDRLEPVGFGESRPIASNADSAGKARNRRVEFYIVERE